MRSKVLKILGLALLALSGAVRAQVQVGTAVVPATETQPVEVRDGAVVLTLEDAVEIALRQNLGLIVQRFTRNQARLGVDQNLGMYDVLASAEAVTADETSPAISTITGSQTNQQAFSFGFNQLVPTGGVFALRWVNSRFEEDSPTTRFSPRYGSNLDFTFDQPLLRDFGRFSTERDLLIARTRNLGSRDEFERQIVVTMQQVINTYWDLVEARQQLIVAQQSLELARELHERNRIQVEVGTLAPLELVQSEAAIATRDEEIIRAQSAVGDAEDELRRLLNLPQGQLWQAEIRPATEPSEEKVSVDLDQAIRTALAERPEVKAQRSAIEVARIQSSFARNQALPSLDLNVNYGLSGAGGTLIERDPITNRVIRTFPGGFDDAFSQVTGFDFSGWTARLTLGVPLQNRTARAQSAIAQLEHQRTEAELQQVEQNIITEVRQAARRLDTAAKQIEAARASVRFQERSLEAERKRYENGMSSSFEITRIQDDLTQARSREVSAVVAYRRAIADFQRATGQLLDAQGVTLDDPEVGVDRWQFRLFGR